MGLRRLSGALAATASLACGLLAGTLEAHAAYQVCRTDPIVLLSNGRQLNIVESVSDVASDINAIQYSVHVPSGVGVRKITYTGGPLKGKESVTFYTDAASGQYTA